MNVSTISEMITTLGFPIVMCIVLCVYVWKIQQKYNAQIDKMTEALNKNTLAISTLTAKLGFELDLGSDEDGDE